MPRDSWWGSLHWLQHIDIDPKNVHILNGNADDLVAECDAYEKARLPRIPNARYHAAVGYCCHGILRPQRHKDLPVASGPVCAIRPPLRCTLERMDGFSVRAVRM